MKRSAHSAALHKVHRPKPTPDALPTAPTQALTMRALLCLTLLALLAAPALAGKPQPVKPPQRPPPFKPVTGTSE